jgi:hypothetical protein
MLANTHDWFARYGVAAPATQVCLIPYAGAKPKIWEALARSARLVIVDDLSFNHEGDTPSLYHELIVDAKRTADSYVGLREIASIAADAAAIEGVTEHTLAALAQ